jgi:hypothetical protein
VHFDQRPSLMIAGIPIAAGENLRTIWEFKNYIVSDAVSYPEYAASEACSEASAVVEDAWSETTVRRFSFAACLRSVPA